MHKCIDYAISSAYSGFERYDKDCPMILSVNFIPLSMQ